MEEIIPEKTDEEIAILVQQGNSEMFGILMSRYKNKFFRYGRKLLPYMDNIEDIVQDIFIKTYENIQSFDVSQKFSPWIYRIAHNEFVNALRKKVRTPYKLVNFDSILSHPIYDDPAVVERERKDVQVLLDKELDKIPPLYREALILQYIEDLSYKEIADVLHIPIGTVGIRLKRGKEILKEMYLNKPHHE